MKSRDELKEILKYNFPLLTDEQAYNTADMMAEIIHDADAMEKLEHMVAELKKSNMVINN